MIRVIIAAILLISGVFCVCVSVLGLFRFKYVLNRMHAAAIVDTLGLFLCVVGLMLLANDFFHVLRFGLAIIFLWLASPVSSNIIAKTEILTNPHLDEKVEDKNEF